MVAPDFSLVVFLLSLGVHLEKKNETETPKQNRIVISARICVVKLAGSLKGKGRCTVTGKGGWKLDFM